MFESSEGDGDGWIPVDSDGFAPPFPFDDDPAADDDAADAGSWDAGMRDLTVGEVLAGLLARRPDAYVMTRLAGIDPRGLAPADAVTWLMVDQKVTAWRAATEVGAYVAAGSGHAQVQELLVHDPRPDRDEERAVRIEDACREEIAVALRSSTQATHDRLVASRLLAGPLTATLEALASGAITGAHARVVTGAAQRLPGCPASIGTAAESTRPVDVAARGEFARLCGRLQDRVVPVASRGTLAQARACARRTILVIDADGETVRRDRARRLRDAFVIPGDDGHCLLAIRLATEVGHACLARIDALAHDSRFLTTCDATIGERRAEAAYALLLAEESSDVDAASGADDASGAWAPMPRLRAHLDITIDLPTLLGLQAAIATATDRADHAALASPTDRVRQTDLAGRSDRADHATAAGGVAEIAGIGPVPADVVRDLLADPAVAVTMRRLVTDPITGHLLDLGRSTYVIPDRLRDFVTARDRTCRFPGCARKAAHCQIDHAHAWSDGGTTSPANLGALCVRHHQLKTHNGWDITTTDADGSCQWESPHGRTYEHEPPPF